jgi:hypothetical protein
MVLRCQAPLLDSLLAEIGLDGADIKGLTGGVTEIPKSKQGARKSREGVIAGHGV